MSIEEAIARIENRVRSSRRLNDRSKGEFLELLDSLWKELDAIPEEQNDRAASITGFMDVSTHEATREEQDQELLNISITGLAKSVQEMEASHPNLASAVNRVCALLANMGI